MLYLTKPGAKELNAYFESLKDNILDAVAAANITQSARDYLIEDQVKRILIDEPAQLLQYHEDFMELLVPQYDEAEYREYFKAKKKRLNLRTAADDQLIGKYEIAEAVLRIFDYENFLIRKKSRSYNLALQMQRNTCSYCNRLYTNTVVYKDPATGRVNDSTRVTKPQFDHWFAHSRYPLLGLSYYNLIPSCSVCNSSVKGDDIFSLATHVHPYIYEPDQHFKFCFYYRDTDQPNVKVIPTGDKMTRHLKAFKIKEVYDAHSNLELKDLLDLKYKYSENYLNTLFEESFKALKVSRRETYRMIFGAHYDEADFHKRAFSKFKKDILNELGIIA